MPLPGWFVHFSAQLGNVKKTRKQGSFHIFYNCLFDACTHCWKKADLIVRASIRREKIGSRKVQCGRGGAQFTLLKRGSLIVMKLYVFHIWFASTHSLPVCEENDLNVVVLSAGTDMIVILN